MLVELAWKNVWRNRKRSIIILTAIAFGLWGGLMASAIMMGWGDSIVNTAINRDLAHIQIHRVGYTTDHETEHFIPDGAQIVTHLTSMPGIKAVSGRTLVEGMAATPSSTFGVQIVGIEPQKARQVTNIHNLLKEGKYLENKSHNIILVGRKLADRLNLKLKSKVILSFQALDSSLVYAAFRVGGIYKSQSSQFDESHVFVRQANLVKLLGSIPAIHEIAIRTTSLNDMPAVLQALRSKYPELSIQPWKELAPEIAVTAEAMISWSYIFVGIILMALIFGITNTMLMAVMERVRELGILIAVGMKKGKVFMMIQLETLMLTLTGGAIGIMLGALTILVFSKVGLDFSFFASSMASFGASAMLYPVLPISMYLNLIVMITIAASAASTMPALKAIHLLPSQAIRSY